MNGVDIGLIVVFGISILLGIMRGLTKEALGLVSWVGAGVAAYILLPFARTIAQQHIQNAMMADAIAAFVMFILFLIIFSLISHVIASYVKDSALGGVDRALGFGFGIGRAIVIACGLELALSSFMPRGQYPEMMKNARFMPMVQHGSEKLLAISPKNLQDFVMNQQLKFVHDHAKKNLENHIQDVIEDKIKEKVDELTENSDHDNTPDTIKPAEKLDPQKTTENLAKLSIQQKNNAKNYDKEQRSDLNRLIETVR